MTFRRRMPYAVASAVVLGALGVASPVSASGPSTPVTGVGTVSCMAVGKIMFNPPLANGGTATTETITVKANLNGCSGTGDGATISQGKAIGTATTTSNDCSTLVGTAATNLTTTTHWKTTGNTAKLVDTTVTYTSSTGGVDSSGKAEIAVTGSATAGSFTGDAASATAVISKSLTAIGNACAKGKLKSLTFNASGSVASLTT